MRITLTQVAKQTGVSISTVSRALRDSPQVSLQTRNHIQHTYDRLKNHSLPQQRKLLGFCMPKTMNSNGHAPQRMFLYEIEAMQEVASEAEYGVLLGTHTAEGKTVTGDMFDRGELSGVVILGADVTDVIFRQLRAHDIPIVLLHRLLNDDSCHCVGVDDELAMRQMTEYVLDKGHTELGYLSGPMTRLPQQDKKKGFIAALQNRGMEVNPQWMLNVRYSQPRGEICQMVCEVLQNKPRPRALVCATDISALAVLDAAHELGLRVPEDLAVTGFDDRPETALSDPPLTTVHMPWNEMMRMATSQLIQLISCPNALENIRVKMATRLVIRDSA
jgi:LacI family transcriptional regulator